MPTDPVAGPVEGELVSSPLEAPWWVRRQADGTLEVRVPDGRWLPAPLELAPLEGPPIPDGATVNRERLTAALNLRGLYGPEVDEAVGEAEPVVDWWEEGRMEPDLEAVRRLATLTGFAPGWFYLEAPPARLEGGFVCQRSGPGRGCHPIGDLAADR